MFVGAVDLIDQQDRRQRARMLDGAEQRPLDQVVPAEQVVRTQRVTLGLGQPDRQQLARVVPFVGGLGDVDALVALQSDQRRAQRRASDFAAEVLPTPASPSSRIGWPSRTEQNNAVASPSSAR